MIRRRVSAVVRLWNGFWGQAVEGAQAQCQIDGVMYKPICKPGGYLVWTDLANGTHTLSVTLAGFEPQTLIFSTSSQDVFNGCMVLKPDRTRYPVRGVVTQLDLCLQVNDKPLAQEKFWLCISNSPMMKIAQDIATAGSDTVRLFCNCPATALALPMPFLLDASQNPELVLLCTWDGQTGRLQTPLVHSHRRGSTLFVAQQYQTDEQGKACIWLREPGHVLVYQNERVYALTLIQGQNTCTLDTSLRAERKD